MDAIGVRVLLAYLAFTVLRGSLLDVWWDGPVLAAAGLAVFAGAMAGQAPGTRRGVVRVLRIVANGEVKGN